MGAVEAVGDAGPSPLNVLSHEARLLLGTVLDARATPGASEGNSRTPAWPALKALMVRERATSVAWPRLPRAVREAAPDEIAHHFRRVAAVEQFRQIQLLRRLEDVLELYPAWEAPPVLLKGAALAHTCYAVPEERPMLDLDLLVGERAARAWRRRLLDDGWAWDEDRYPEEAYERHFHLPPLEDARGTGALIELHTGLFIPGHPFTLDPPRLRALSRESEMAGRPVLVPRPEAHLLYICLHFAWSHALSTGGWRTFRDVAALTGSADFAWSGFVEMARRSRGGAYCYWTLRLAARLGGVPVAGRVLDELRPALPDAVLSALERHFALRLFSVGSGCPSVRLGRALWRLGMRADDGPGGVRPWDHREDFAAAQEGADGALRRAIEQIRDAPRWTGYLARVLALHPET